MTKRLFFSFFAFAIINSSSLFGQTYVGKNKLWKQGEKGDAYVQSEIVSSDLYGKNIGKILFSSKPTDINGSDSQFSNSFVLGEPIYCRVFLETCLPNYKLYSHADNVNVNSDNGYIIKAYIDNDKKPSNEYDKDAYYCGAGFNQTKQNDNKVSFEFLFATDNKNGKTESDADFMKKVSALQDGKHTIRLFMYASFSGNDSKNPIAFGEFTFTKSANSKIKLGKSFNDVEAKMKDPKLEAEAMKAITEFYTEFTGISKGAKPLKLKFVDANWTMMNSKSGVLVGRQIHIKVLVKNTDGSCKIVLYPLDQQYNGKGFQENFTKAIASSPYYEQGTEICDCE